MRSVCQIKGNWKDPLSQGVFATFISQSKFPIYLGIPKDTTYITYLHPVAISDTFTTNRAHEA